MSDAWADHLARERERYRRVVAGVATADELADQAAADAFDRDYFKMFGRYPEESRFNAGVPDDSRRRAAIQALIDRGATEGERDAARAAMARLDAPDDDEQARLERDRQDEEDFEDAMSHGAA